MEDEADRVFDGLVEPLFKFYEVGTIVDLIRAQSDHVERLQDKVNTLNKANSLRISRPKSYPGGYRQG